VTNEVRVIEGDCLKILPTLEAGSFDAVITDPPYGLSFMGNDWDHGVPGVPFWSAAMATLKPGGCLLAFGGTRTYHRLACAIEDAGFEIRDCLLWLYGTGFPKGRGCLKPAYEIIILAKRPLNADDEYNSILANLSVLESHLWCLCYADIAAKSSSSTQVGRDGGRSSALPSADETLTLLGGLSAQMGTSQFVSAASTCLNIVSSWKAIWEEASQPLNTSTTRAAISPTTDWRTLKSCLSGITLPSIIRAELEAPGSLLRALSAARYFNAVCASINATLELSALESATSPGHISRLGADAPERSPAYEPIILARKPGPKVLPLGIDECRVPTSSEDAEKIKRGVEAMAASSRKRKGHDGWHRPWQDDDDLLRERTTQSVEAAVALGRYPANVLHDGSEEVLEAFAAFGEKPGAVSNGSKTKEGHCGTGTFKIHARPQTPGRGDSGTAARFFYCAKASKSERGEDNNHPTVKPLELLKWLVRLACPPGGTALDPFAGSGTTGVAARLEGRNAVLIEQSPEYCDIIRRRLGEPTLAATDFGPLFAQPAPL